MNSHEEYIPPSYSILVYSNKRLPEFIHCNMAKLPYIPKCLYYQIIPIITAYYFIFCD